MAARWKEIAGVGVLLTLFGDVDQIPDLARSALALIFRIIPTNTHTS